MSAAIGFALGVFVTLLVGFFIVTWSEWMDLPCAWREEADCILAPWLRALRRLVRKARTERCFACGQTHVMTNALSSPDA